MTIGPKAIQSLTLYLSGYLKRNFVGLMYSPNPKRTVDPLLPDPKGQVLHALFFHMTEPRSYIFLSCSHCLIQPLGYLLPSTFKL